MSAFITLAESSLRISLPYLAAAMAGIWSERAGVVNVALEGTLTVGALGTCLGTLFTGSPTIGLLTAICFGVGLQVVHGVSVLFLSASAMVSGVALNLLAHAMTRFTLRSAYGSAANSPNFPSLHPFVMSTLCVVVAIVTIVALAKTRFGLHVRAAGERPEALAAHTISVPTLRMRALMTAGLCGGVGGAWLAFDQHQVVSGMSGGRGYIALAAVVSASWDPTRAAIACLVFGTLEATQITLQGNGWVSHQVVQMLPYIATLLALAGLLGRSRPPAALRG